MLTIKQAGIQSTIQADRRTGYRHLGVISAGPLDRVGMATANILAGNSRKKSCIEIVAGTFSVVTDAPIFLSITGHGYEVVILNRTPTCEHSKDVKPSTRLNCNWRIELKSHQTLKIRRTRSSGVCYIATPGGFESESFMGSRSTDQFLLRGGIGGRPIKAGDTFKASSRIKSSTRPALTTQGIRPLENDFQIRAIAGPDYDLIEPAASKDFWRSRWRLGATRSRMGIRLLRDAGSNNHSTQNTLAGSLASHAVIPGTIQLPNSDEPIVLTSDCQTTGGYGKIAVVIAADLWKLVQTPQEVSVQFVAVDKTTAITALANQEKYLEYLENAFAIGTKQSAFR